jgi:hypothetical protein
VFDKTPVRSYHKLSWGIVLGVVSVFHRFVITEGMGQDSQQTGHQTDYVRY